MRLCVCEARAACRSAAQRTKVREPAPAQQDPKAGEPVQRFALLCIGELGRTADLSAFPALPDALTAALGSEGVAEAASAALGGVAGGNQAAYLPLLLRHTAAQVRPLA